jgi:hypothetical protein
MCLDPACGQFSGELAQREGAGLRALAQPLRRRTRQNRSLVPADLAVLQAARLTLQLLPLRYARRADVQRIADLSDRCTTLRKQKRTFTQIFRIIPNPLRRDSAGIPEAANM